MEVRLRDGRVDDAETCGSICYEAFKAISDQHNFPPDFPNSKVTVELVSFLLSRGDVYSVVAEVDGRVLSPEPSRDKRGKPRTRPERRCAGSFE